VRLIFKAGFSTSVSVTDVSGRGVGMDIVSSHIEKLNGIIDIETKVGKGTQFRIKLPLTLAIVSGLLVELGRNTYVLPMSNVVEIVRIPEKQVQSIHEEKVIMIRGEVVPLVRLHDSLGEDYSQRIRNNLFVVIVGIGAKRLALVVDELKGNQDIVVKSIGTYIGKGADA
jgi:two-component system chemotaxis sensor kinase CheA